MTSTTLRLVIDALFQCDKASFTLKGRDREKNTYEFTIDSKISLKITSNKDEDKQIQTVYNKVEDIPVKPLIVTNLEERRYNFNGGLTQKNTQNFYREIELFITIFKILSQNVVFLIKDTHTMKICFFISSRVFYLSEASDIIEVSELNLFKLYSLMDRPEIIMFSKLPKKYKYVDFFTEVNKLSEKKKKLFTNTKEGVEVR